MHMNLIPEESFIDISKLLVNVEGKVIIGPKSDYTNYIIPDSFWYNRVWINKQINGNIVDSIQDIASKKDKYPLLVSYTKDQIDPSIEEALKANGFDHLTNQIGMIFPLSDYVKVQDDVHIIQIGKEQVKQWSETLSAAFEKPLEYKPFETLIENENCYFYAYVEDEKIVGTAMFYANPENTGIHEVGTLMNYRGRGIAKSLIYKILNKAKELNVSLVSLQASEAGEKVYSKIGFKEVSIIPTWIMK